MDIEVVMPAIGAGTTQGKILQWLKQSGDTVKVGDILAEIETDKAVIELEALDDGVLDRIHVPAGDTEVPVGDVIATLMRKGAGAQPPANPPPAAAPVSAPIAAPAPVAAVAAPADARSGLAEHRLFASPSARRLARALGVDLHALAGSGPNGRIVRVDIENAAAARPAQSAPAVAVPAGAALQPHTPMRATIARRLVQSKQQVPHFYLTVDCRMDAMMAARAALNARGQAAPEPVRHSLNDLLAMAVARAVARVPAINAQWTDEGIARLAQVDLSIAVALDSGLITPIVRNADRKSLSEISAEIAQLAEQARRGRLRPEQYEGGSLTLSNLGMHGVREFAAIINPPQSVILAAGAVVRQPVVDGDDIRVGHVMSLTLSADHRVVDGALGARFLGAVKQLLENPIELIL
ncbi:dihydrolipoamide acetyltransferase family protein [Achromobacter insolitus]|uniref:dihydrolipoamide acetyltransferase family protein n=1 Tax=Achromobacter TaxID=222 RepID=UPI00053826EC|nr:MULTISPECIES: dihydrolipoamide acetyltransferase family protein [Achromobacter]AVG42581.1 2-oxo acid dehydrogenase subunit E2 [Achromobacter insolitus]MEB3094298.1 dihydrolipoamide acetyltransferase family protein [Achromobacter sp. D10]WKK17300.1 dihydrolipoamide acetyltransferase family protein [Achromobacter insolitus]